MKIPIKLSSWFVYIGEKNLGFPPKRYLLMAKAFGRYIFLVKTTSGMLSEKTFSPPLGDGRFGALRQYFCQPPIFFGRRWEMAGFSVFPFHGKRIEFLARSLSSKSVCQNSPCSVTALCVHCELHIKRPPFLPPGSFSGSVFHPSRIY